MTQLARLVDIYTMLAPYTKTLVAENAAKGTPVMRPLFLHYEDDPRSYTEQFEYLYGSDLLVAPVCTAERPSGRSTCPVTRGSTCGPARSTVRHPHRSRRDGRHPGILPQGSQWTELFDSIREKYGK